MTWNGDCGLSKAVMFIATWGRIPGIVITMEGPQLYMEPPQLYHVIHGYTWIIKNGLCSYAIYAPTAAFQQLRRKLPDSHNPVQRPAVQSCSIPD